MTTARFIVAVAAVLSLAVPVGGALAASPAPSTATAPDVPPTGCPAGAPLVTGEIATIAGTGTSGSSGDGGSALAATIDPKYVTPAVDASGAVYLYDTPSASIRRIGTDGAITTIAGRATGATLGNGYTSGAPVGLAFGRAGDLFVSDFRSARIWRLDPSGVVTSVAGTGVMGWQGVGGPATEAQIGLTQVAVGPAGDLYFDAGPGFATVDTAGIIHGFAGTGTPGFSGDGGPAIAAQVSDETLGVATDQAGDVYLADVNNHRIRMVDPSGVITTIAGTGVSSDSGDGGPAIQATLDDPSTIAVDQATGDVYFSEPNGSRVRRIGIDGLITTVAGTGTPGYSGDCGPATEAQLDQPYGLAVHDGALYMLDEGNHRVRVVGL